MYITDILHIFGAINGPRGGIGFPIGGADTGDVRSLVLLTFSDYKMKWFLFKVEKTVMPYLTAMSEFRDSVREHARNIKATDILKICDSLRDEILPNMGVRLEDREGT